MIPVLDELPLEDLPRESNCFVATRSCRFTEAELRPFFARGGRLYMAGFFVFLEVLDTTAWAPGAGIFAGSPTAPGDAMVVP